jgi:hypothetical protein
MPSPQCVATGSRSAFSQRRQRALRLRRACGALRCVAAPCGALRRPAAPLRRPAAPCGALARRPAVRCADLRRRGRSAQAQAGDAGAHRTHEAAVAGIRLHRAARFVALAQERVSLERAVLVVPDEVLDGGIALHEVADEADAGFDLLEGLLAVGFLGSFATALAPRCGSLPSRRDFSTARRGQPLRGCGLRVEKSRKSVNWKCYKPRTPTPSATCGPTQNRGFPLLRMKWLKWPHANRLDASMKSLTLPVAGGILMSDVSSRAACKAADVVLERDAFRGQLTGRSEPGGPAAR